MAQDAPAISTAEAEPSASPSTWPVLQPGDTGAAVRQLQAELGRLGVFNAPPDGVYGPQTQAAVQAFQQDYGLTPDGIVGTQTWQALARAQHPQSLFDSQFFAREELLAFTPLTFSQPPPPPSPLWLVLMPLIPLIGGILTYLQRQLRGREPIKTPKQPAANRHSRHNHSPKR